MYYYIENLKFSLNFVFNLITHGAILQNFAFSIKGSLTGSPLMYQDRLLGGLLSCAIHIKSAVSPTWYCCLGVSIVGPSCGRSRK